MSAQRRYFTMGLDCDLEWPSKEHIVKFRGMDITLRPETDKLAPSAVIQIDGPMSENEARRMIQEFLSGLVWVRRRGVTEIFSSTSSAFPVGIGKRDCRLISDAPIEYVPDPPSPKAKLALALYREAISVNLVPYQFLGFFKIINVLHSKGSEQQRWINKSIALINNSRALARIGEISQQEGDIGRYLYVSGRCAVAHAFAEPIVNPDNPDDIRRLASDLPVIQCLAELAIELELGVHSNDTVLEEHKYELEGFRELFGKEVVERLKANEAVDASLLKVPSQLSIWLRGQEQLSAFKDMRAQVAVQKHGVVALHLQSSYPGLTAAVHLLFSEERLVFDAEHFLNLEDDGSVDAAVCLKDAREFFRRWLLNGVTEVWNDETKSRLGRSQPVLPVNMRLDWEKSEQGIQEAQDLIDSRIRQRQHTKEHGM